MDTALIKEFNIRRLRSHLTERREATVYVLSKLSALSVVTVKTLLTEMIAQGEVFEGDLLPSGGGRPSQIYVYNGKFRHAVVIYGHQKDSRNLIHVLVVNLFGECVYRDEEYFDDVQVESFCGMIDRAIEAYPRAATIAFGLPGFEENGTIVANDYCGIVGDTFMRFYKSRFGLPVVFLNDVNAAVKGYSQPNQDCACLVGIYFPRIYMPGAGMVINGEVYLGSQHFAGEIGNLLPDLDWMSLGYDNGFAVTDAIAKLLSIYCRIVAPNQFILYGDFLSKVSKQEIEERTQDLLSGQFRVNVALSSTVENDFERGMIALALEQLSETFL